jgi:hypothetical protein
MNLSSDDFARAFGDALQRFLQENRIPVTRAAEQLGVKRETLYTYWKDDKDGKRKKPRIELLFLACVELDFAFEYNGYRINAEALATPRAVRAPKGEQLSLNFSREFNLTEDDGLVSVRLKRHPGRVEFSVSLKAAS